MEFPICPRRQKLVAIDREGNRGRVDRCHEQTSDFFNLDVLPSDCNSCSARDFAIRSELERNAAGIIAVHEIGQIAEKYPDNGTDPIWPICKDRSVARIEACCGEDVRVRICESPSCPRLGREVLIPYCESCPVRRE